MTTRNWTTSFNNDLDLTTYATLDAQAKRAVRTLKNVILAAGYEVYQSCDAVSAGAEGDGVDRWDADSDLTWASGGAARSWFVARRALGQLPGTRRTVILIELSTGASSQHQINVYVGTTTPTGGTTTAAPTFASPTNRLFFNAKQFLRSTLTNCRYHSGYSDAGDWFFFISPNGSGRAMFFAASFISGASTFESGTQYPCIDIWSFADTGNGGPTSANLQISTHIAMFNSDGTVQSSGSMGVVTPNISTVNVMSLFTSAGSTISSYWPKVPVPIGQFSTTVAFKGTLVDVWFAPTGTGVLQGTETPASGTSEYALIGDFWIPNGGVSPQL